MADIYIEKKDLDLDLLFDLVVEDNDLKKDNTYITAAMMSIFTDASKPQIGTQIDGKILGNENYNIDKLSQENIKAYEDGILKAVQWLIDDSIVTNIVVETEKTGNRLDVNITFTTDSENDDNLKYSLDESLNILGEFIVEDISYIIDGGTPTSIDSFIFAIDGGTPSTISDIINAIDGGVI